ncbi:hypothetical protein ACHQM5_019237 [Ranunculus cassubicifolius]
MANRREKPVWMSIPQFGGWDGKTGGAPDYSMVFNRARANRKEVKKDVKRASLGNKQELFRRKKDVPHTHHVHHAHHVHHDDEYPISKKKRILTYFNCCIKA